MILNSLKWENYMLFYLKELVKRKSKNNKIKYILNQNDKPLKKCQMEPLD
jgi:hypothetical protein